MLPAYVHPIDVRFRDLDVLDHVNHAVVLTYAETARCDWFAKAAGIADMARLPFLVASAHAEYKAPIRKTDPVEIAMWLTRVGEKSWTFRYDVRQRATKAVFAEVETVQVSYDHAAGKTTPIPDALVLHLQRLQVTGATHAVPDPAIPPMGGAAAKPRRANHRL